MCTATSEIRPNIRAVVAIKVLTVIIIVILSNFLFNKIMLQPLLIAFLLNCTAKVRIVCEHSKLFALIFPSAPSFLVYINPLDMRQSVSTQRNSSEFLWSSD